MRYAGNLLSCLAAPSSRHPSSTAHPQPPQSLSVHLLQVPRRMIGTDAFQETPIVEVTRQITKHNYLVMDVRDLPRIVKEVRHVSSLMSPRGICKCHHLWQYIAASYAYLTSCSCRATEEAHLAGISCNHEYAGLNDDSASCRRFTLRAPDGPALC